MAELTGRYHFIIIRGVRCTNVADVGISFFMDSRPVG